VPQSSMCFIAQRKRSNFAERGRCELRLDGFSRSSLHARLSQLIDLPRTTVNGATGPHQKLPAALLLPGSDVQDIGAVLREA
jgi:hypothetical protein